MTKLLLLGTFFLMVLEVLAQDYSLFDKNSAVTKVGGGYKFTEGPAVAPDGRVFFTDQPEDKIYFWTEKCNKISTFLNTCERANGTYFNRKGELVACADLHNRLVAFDLKGKMKVLAENFNQLHLNGPNDLWIAPNGGLYFSDPYYQREYWEPRHVELQDKRAVYYLNPEGKVTRVIDDYKQPNGLIGTPDGKTLYVSDISDGKIWKYDIQADGNLASKTLFAPEGSDGMTIDEHGNVYLTNKVVSVFNPEGKNIARIEVPEQPSNVCFGGKKRNILFITARTSVYILKMNVKGVQ
jgi:gluconolactonase